MKPPALLIIEPEHRDCVFDAAAIARLEVLLDIIAPPQTAKTHAKVGDRLREVEVIVSTWGMPRMDEAFLRMYPSLRAVFYAAGSVRSFVTDAVWARGISIVSAAAANAVAVADFTCAQIHLSLKRAFQLMFSFRRDRRRDRYNVAGVFRSTVGLLGLGHIGRLVAERLGPSGVKLLAYDPFVASGVAAKLGVRLCPLDTVFSAADVVSCHVPLLPDTRQMLRETHFRNMKLNATFINTARGAVVAENEMIEVLRQRTDLFALLDVTDPEPPLPASPLYDLPNVFLTPHIAGCQAHERLLLGLSIVEDVARYTRGEAIPNTLSRGRAMLMA